ncbi:hypothetical protein O7626_01715 [Micromonospora sp. WMMD1102]|uniref:hypothetical protein n=1 Tax=Micromonospora sp. WMMD1102 TaxID=3016105 RepID=UPI0024154C8A|nr:hypothetical protein [Micromonospora sp. WMMD1102]MDG4784660.1 hypothetical protein [Micromonospora sp. WMMD1102]
MSSGMVVLLLIVVAFAGALAILIPIRLGKRQKLQDTAAVLSEFAMRNGMRFGRFEPNLPGRAPDINDIVGDPMIYVDFQIDGAMRGVPFQAFQVRRPAPRQHAVTFEVSTRTPEYTVVLVPRPVAGPPLRLAPQRLSWATAFRRDIQIGDPQFDATFHVSTDTPAFAQFLLRPPLIHWLAADPRASQAIIVFEPSDLMAVVRGPLTPDSAMTLADLMTDLHQRIPWRSLTH